MACTGFWTTGAVKTAQLLTRFFHRRVESSEVRVDPPKLGGLRSARRTCHRYFCRAFSRHALNRFAVGGGMLP